ncbi:DegV family protein [Weissella viridescens]|uniref:DegV family protein n=1 Tax=Weissella viridescens TaxID=1629 RepID=UPI001C7D4732|nr:DegV family protein [Weissella viridescens]MBX4172515.1 DegV family protein [Weissella viridescens]MCB6840772.1 DegV family protein [Weissella viridescens]MCB6847511.1 DegV family protein [Weissella viridescens]WJI91822.1 DegV family protein [Weissella viridescens]
MTVAIVTDSTAYLTADEIKNLKIEVVPIPVIIDGTTYQEGIDLKRESFYDLLAQAEHFPTTSQPAVGEWLTLFERLKQAGYDEALVINLSSTISGAGQTVAGLATSISDFKVHAYDSKLTVRIMGQLVLKAAQMAQEGASVETITHTLDALRETIDEYFVVDDLQNLSRGGRLSNASALVGTMLKVKPILTFDPETNYIVPFEKVRSMKKALARTEQLFENAIAEVDYPIHAIVIYSNNAEQAEKWMGELQTRFPEVTFELSYFGPVIGTHLGAGSLALGWMREPDSV